MATTKGKPKSLKAGIQIGYWLLLSEAPVRPGGNRYWFCRCTKCNTTHEVKAYTLRTRKTRHCKKCNEGRPNKNGIIQAGMVIGWWTVLREGHPYKMHKRWWCQCRCGTVRLQRQTHLNRAVTLSCGCGRGYHNSMTTILKHWEAMSPEQRARFNFYKEQHDSKHAPGSGPNTSSSSSLDGVAANG